MKNLTASMLLMFLFSGTAWAQGSNGWDWRVTPYLWGVNIDGTLSIGQLSQNIDASFSDILSDMDFGGSVFAEIGRGNHSVHVDYTYLRLKPDPSRLPNPPFPGESTLSSKMTNNIFETAYNYRFDGPGSTALVLGARYLDIEMRLTPNIDGPDLPVDVVLPVDPVTAGPSWWDYFVGVRSDTRISANWDFGFYGTIGTGGSDLPWTLEATFGRRFSNDNRLVLGARVWSIDYARGRAGMDQFTRVDMMLYGFVIGYEFN